MEIFENNFTVTFTNAAAANNAKQIADESFRALRYDFYSKQPSICAAETLTIEDDVKREFLRLTTPTITEDGLHMEAQSFFAVKKWFLAEFPQVKDACQKHIEAVREINEAIDSKIAEAKKQAEKAKNEKAQAEAEEFLKAV